MFGRDSAVRRGRQTRDGAAVRRVQVMLDEETIDRAKALGDGNLSIGLRKMARGTKMDEYGKFESWEQMDDARERIASGLEDGDVQEHVARYLTYRPRFDTWWLPAVWSEQDSDLREKLLEELGPTSPSGHMSEECGWEIEES